jgi:hypothetical protein
MRLNTSPRSQPMPATDGPSRWVAELFAKLAVQYGRRFLSLFDSDAAKELALREWSRVLDGVDPNTVDAYLLRRDPTYPPDVMEIRGACKPPRVAAHQPYRALPRPPRNPDTARNHLADLRAALRRDEYLPRDAA